MKLKHLLLIMLLAASTTMAQNKEAESTRSIEAIIESVYRSISGDAGEKRDWDHFRSLFHADARLIPTETNPETKLVNAKALTPEQYIERAAPYFEKNGFYERETARRIEQFGNIAHVFSTYSSFRTSTEKDPFARGINSFQLMFDGKRWWIVTIYWQQESKEFPIPAKYLSTP